MNILTDLLPKTVTVGGEKCPINTDFRVSIRFELLMQNASLPDQDKALKALELYYPRAPCDAQGACDGMLWFYRCGKEETARQEGSGDGGGEARRVYDFAYDADYIYAAFLAQYGVDLQETAYLHWWKFRAMFRALDENCEFVKIMGYRAMRIPAKMPKGAESVLPQDEAHPRPALAKRRERKAGRDCQSPDERRRRERAALRGWTGSGKRKARGRCAWRAPNAAIRCPCFTTHRRKAAMCLSRAKGAGAARFLK